MAVTFENVRIHEATILSPTHPVHFHVSILSGSGSFSIRSEEGNIVATGFIKQGVINGKSQPAMNKDSNQDHTQQSNIIPILPLQTSDIYTELRLRGYEYGSEFQPLLSSDNEGNVIKVVDVSKYITYDTLLM